MTAPKHAAREWRLDADGVTVHTERGTVIVEAGCPRGAPDGGSRTHETARLIAAAPDMRGALEPDLLDLAAEACDRAGTKEMADVAAELRAKARIERAAIAKTEGRA